jgi:hypothetical protein
VEDWEEFFLEKSRRRFDKERLERRRERTRTAITVTLLVVLILFAIVGLAYLA